LLLIDWSGEFDYPPESISADATYLFDDDMRPALQGNEENFDGIRSAREAYDVRVNALSAITGVRGCFAAVSVDFGRR
jgi:hypothetical protein